LSVFIGIREKTWDVLKKDRITQRAGSLFGGFVVQ